MSRVVTLIQLSIANFIISINKLTDKVVSVKDKFFIVVLKLSKVPFSGSKIINSVMIYCHYDFVLFQL